MLSVIIPVLKYDFLLLRCISSFAAIFGKDDIELTIVAPFNKLEKLKVELDSLDLPFDYNLTKETGSGIYSAMNDGIISSKGEFLAFFGQDDFVLPAYINFFEKVLNADDLATVFSCDILMGEFYLERSKFKRSKFLTGNYCHQALIYRRSLFKNKSFDTKYKIMADKVFNMSVINKKSFLYFPITCAYFSTDGASSSQSDLIFKKDFKTLLVDHYGWHVKFILWFRDITSKLSRS
jgi:glycosyltransferase involved in cell wall biosynthesis